MFEKLLINSQSSNIEVKEHARLEERSREADVEISSNGLIKRKSLQFFFIYVFYIKK